MSDSAVQPLFCPLDEFLNESYTEVIDPSPCDTVDFFRNLLEIAGAVSFRQLSQFADQFLFGGNSLSVATNPIHSSYQTTQEL